jgi:hypothetical protein
VNIIGGLNRISLVLAITAVVPGFLLGWAGYSEWKTKTLPKPTYEDIGQLSPLQLELISLAAGRDLTQEEVKRWAEEGQVNKPSQSSNSPKLRPWKEIETDLKFSNATAEIQEQARSTWLGLAFSVLEPGLSDYDRRKLIDRVYPGLSDYGRQTLIGRLYQDEHPSAWECAIAGVVASEVAFLLVLFGIQGIKTWCLKSKKRINEGLRRLSIGCGLLGSLLGIVAGGLLISRHSVSVEGLGVVVFLGFMACLGYILFWSFVRLTFWVIEGFRADRT